MVNFEKIRTLVEQTQRDVDKFYNKGNDSAGVRVRKAMQDLKDLAHQVRKDIQEIREKENKKGE